MTDEVRDCPHCGHDARRTDDGFWYCPTCHQPHGMTLERSRRRQARGSVVPATSVRRANSTLGSLLGLRGDGLDTGEAFVMDHSGGWILVDMLATPDPLDVVWSLDGEVRKVKRLRPWVGVGIGPADQVVELPAGVGAAVEVGDELAIDEEFVESSPYAWREMAMKQARVPVWVGTLVVAGFYLVDFQVQWYQALLAVAFLGYATLPAIGSYLYYREES